MTHLMDASPLTPGQTEEHVATDEIPTIGYTVAELQYLLSLAPGSAADRSASLLNVGPVPNVTESILTGGASLLVRGQLNTENGEEFVPTDAALVITYILTRATRWSMLSGSSGTATDFGLFVEAPEGILLAQPRTLGTWWFMVLDPQSDPAAVVADSAIGLSGLGEDTGVLVSTSTLSHDRSFTLRRRGGVWSWASGATGSSEPDERVQDATQGDVARELAAFITTFPADKE